MAAVQLEGGGKGVARGWRVSAAAAAPSATRRGCHAVRGSSMPVPGVRHGSCQGGPRTPRNQLGGIWGSRALEGDRTCSWRGRAAAEATRPRAARQRGSMGMAGRERVGRLGIVREGIPTVHGAWCCVKTLAPWLE